MFFFFFCIHSFSPPDIFGEELLDDEVRDEDAERGGEHCDEETLDQPVEVPRRDVDDEVAPGEGQRDEHVEEGEHRDDGHVVLVLHDDEDAADVVAEEVAGQAEQGHDQEEPEAPGEAGVETAGAGAAGNLRGGRGAGAPASGEVRAAALGVVRPGLALVGVDHDDPGRHLGWRCKTDERSLSRFADGVVLCSPHCAIGDANMDILRRLVFMSATYFMVHSSHANKCF